MASPKENFLKLMRFDDPKWLGDPWDCFYQNPYAFRPILFDAVTISLGGPLPGQTGVKDAWGVTRDWPAGQPGATPNITPENKVIKDIKHWRDYVRFPDFSDAPWDAACAPFKSIDREKELVMTPSFTGLFEFSHDMMGFEDALVSYVTEPEAMYEMLGAYTDWKIRAVGETIDRMRPDIIHSHDDWASKTALFISPGTWREIIKPHYKRFYDYIKSRGVLVQHHADCYCQDIVEDMVELGIDMWQGVIPQNDIPAIIERTEGKLCLMGGLDMQLLDMPRADEKLIRAKVRECIDRYAPLGHFIPCVPNVIPIYRDVETAINDELTRYGAEWAEKHWN